VADRNDGVGAWETVALPPPHGAPMCFKCNQIDDRIARYRWIEGQMRDNPTLAAIKRLIVELEEQRTGFHPEQK
jgi:hypothetical protein